MPPVSPRVAIGISIHAPREGSDIRLTPKVTLRYEISIHAPREGSDIFSTLAALVNISFLSTLPARGATGTSRSVPRGVTYFYPRSPRGERQVVADAIHQSIDISIHAPREGSDGTSSQLTPI